MQFVVDFSATIDDIVCPPCIKAAKEIVLVSLRWRVVLLYFKARKRADLKAILDAAQPENEKLGLII